MRIIEVIPYKNFKDRIRIMKEEKLRGAKVSLEEGYVISTRTQNSIDGFVEKIKIN